MTNIDELKNKIQNIMDENKPAIKLDSKEDRQIRELEKGLTSLGLKSEIQIKLSTIKPESTNEMFAGGKFTYDQYSLGWKEMDGNYRLALTNIPYNNSKVLIMTPEQFKVAITPLLEDFSKELEKVIKNSQAVDN